MCGRPPIYSHAAGDQDARIKVYVHKKMPRADNHEKVMAMYSNVAQSL